VKIVAERAAEKNLAKLPQATALRIIERLRAIAADPDGLAARRHANVKSFGGNLYRLRVGQWRAVFYIEGDKLIVARIGHRREVYRD
jgi:mRNA interferase RelE/StbE